MKGLYYLLLVLVAFVAVGVLAIFAARGSPSNNAVLTDARPTLTLVPTWTAISTTKKVTRASVTPTPKPTATPLPYAIVNSQMNVRAGPGTSFIVIGQANGGDKFEITGANVPRDWWQIDYNGRMGWVYADLVSTQREHLVPLAMVIPAEPTPRSSPTARPVARAASTSVPVVKPSDLHIDLLSLLQFNEQFILVEVYIEAEVIQVLGPQVEYTLIIYDGSGYGYLNLDNTPVKILPGDIVKGIVEVTGTNTYENILGYDVTVPLLYGIDLNFFR